MKLATQIDSMHDVSFDRIRSIVNEWLGAGSNLPSQWFDLVGEPLVEAAALAVEHTNTYNDLATLRDECLGVLGDVQFISISEKLGRAINQINNHIEMTLMWSSKAEDEGVRKRILSGWAYDNPELIDERLQELKYMIYELTLDGIAYKKD